jgi:outer membrane autotransporter protein
VTLGVVFNGAALAGFAQTPNQQAVAAALAEAQPTATGDLATVFENLVPLTVQEVPAVLDSMSGEPLTAFTHTRLALGQRLDRVIHTRLYDLGPALEPAAVSEVSQRRAARAARRAEAGELPPVSLPPAGAAGFGAWLDGFGAFGGIEGSGGASDLDYQIGGGAFGVDWRASPEVAVGGAFAYAYTDLDYPDQPATGHANSFLGALYGAYGTRRLHLGASARVGHHEMESARGIAFSDIDRSARADFDGRDYGARVEAALELLPDAPLHVQPVAAFSYVHLASDDFTERGADSLDLEVDGEAIDSLVSEVGARVHARFEMDEGTWFAPELWARWLHELGDTDRRLDVRLSGATTGGAFRVVGADLPRDAAVFGVRWTTSSREGAGAVISYEGIWNSDLLENAIRLGFQFVW